MKKAIIIIFTIVTLAGIVFFLQNNPGDSATELADYSDIIGNSTTEEIDYFISSYAEPLYNEIYPEIYFFSSGDVSYWNGSTSSKMLYSAGANMYDMSREYYYDSKKNLILAVVFDDDSEQRFYFLRDTLICHVGADGKRTDNPTSNEVLQLGKFILDEALY